MAIVFLMPYLRSKILQIATDDDAVIQLVRNTQERDIINSNESIWHKIGTS